MKKLFTKDNIITAIVVILIIAIVLIVTFNYEIIIDLYKRGYLRPVMV
jgi:hypothetical protein